MTLLALPRSSQYTLRPVLPARRWPCLGGPSVIRGTFPSHWRYKNRGAHMPKDKFFLHTDMVGKLEFLANNVHDTAIVLGSTTTTLFNISTSDVLGGRTTTVTGTLNQVVGLYERSSTPEFDSTVTIRGETKTLTSWLPKSGASPP